LAAGHKTNTKKSIPFLYKDNEQTRKEIMETISFTIASKNKIPRNKFNEEN
jgi:hypothetical protein